LSWAKRVAPDISFCTCFLLPQAGEGLCKKRRDSSRPTGAHPRLQAPHLRQIAHQRRDVIKPGLRHVVARRVDVFVLISVATRATVDNGVMKHSLAYGLLLRRRIATEPGWPVLAAWFTACSPTSRASFASIGEMMVGKSVANSRRCRRARAPFVRGKPLSPRPPACRPMHPSRKAGCCRANLFRRWSRSGYRPCRRCPRKRDHAAAIFRHSIAHVLLEFFDVEHALRQIDQMRPSPSAWRANADAAVRNPALRPITTLTLMPCNARLSRSSPMKAKATKRAAEAKPGQWSVTFRSLSMVLGYARCRNRNSLLSPSRR